MLFFIVPYLTDIDFASLLLAPYTQGYVAHSGTPADTQNFNLLLRDVREELDKLHLKTGRFYGLTAALPCGPSNINNIDIQEVSKYLTEFNLMSYGAFFARIPCFEPTPIPSWLVFFSIVDTEAIIAKSVCPQTFMGRGTSTRGLILPSTTSPPTRSRDGALMAASATGSSEAPPGKGSTSAWGFMGGASETPSSCTWSTGAQTTRLGRPMRAPRSTS